MSWLLLFKCRMLNIKGLRSIWKFLLQELRKLTSSFAKLESELAISMNVTTVLSERLMQMERQCWVNTQCPWTVCVEMVGIFSLVYHNHLEDSVCKIFDKLNCNIVKTNLKDCNCLKSNCVILKFSKKKDCKQVLSVKKDLKMSIWLTLTLSKVVQFT